MRRSRNWNTDWSARSRGYSKARTTPGPSGSGFFLVFPRIRRRPAIVSRQGIAIVEGMGRNRNTSEIRGRPGPNAFLRMLDRIYCRVWQRLEGEARHLPEGPLILVGNHRAGVDPLLVQASVNRPLRFLMAREYYDAMWYARWLFDMCGAIPVNPGGANRHSLARAVRAVHAGQALCLFPEGGANPDIPLARILPGAVVIAMETGAPILPFRITGTWPFDHVHLWHSFVRRGRGRVRFGAPFSLPPVANDRQAIQTATRLMQQALKNIGADSNA